MTAWRPKTGRATVGALIAALSLCAAPQPVLAFDFFGLFGSGDRPPPVSQESLPYTLTIGDSSIASDLRQAVEDASILHRLRQEPPREGVELVRRAEADLPRLIDAMWGHGHYAARVSIDIAGVLLTYGQPAPEAAARAAEALRGRSHVPVRIVLEPGPLYRFADIAIVDAASGQPIPAGVLPDNVLIDRREGAVAGAPARTAILVNLASRIVTHFRRQGHPYAKVEDPAPVIDHRARTISISLTVVPGPRAPIGDIAIEGAEKVDPRVIRSFIYIEPGVMYAPERLQEIRTSVNRIEAIGSTRVQTAETLDADGSVPLTVNVTERLPRALGVAATYSSVDGPSVRGYWMHRNLFGGAERLRLDANLFYLTTGPRNLTARPGRFTAANAGGRLAASFVKPALGGSRVDLHADAHLLRESAEGYTTRLGNAVVALRRRLSDRAWVQIGVEGEIGQTRDHIGVMDYGLIGLPISAQWDSTDNVLDPTRGFRVSGQVTPYKGFGDAAPLLVATRLAASAYYALDGDSRYILAGRMAVATISGGSIGQIPGNRRLFAGGGGSVRGYAYRSLGPRTPTGLLIGGRSLFEASAEARIRITDTFGIVPFIDVGNAFASPVPSFSDLRFGAGLGLRYYTALGPIRVDFAVPVGRRPGEAQYAVYFSIGQAF